MTHSFNYPYIHAALRSLHRVKNAVSQFASQTFKKLTTMTGVVKCFFFRLQRKLHGYHIKRFSTNAHFAVANSSIYQHSEFISRPMQPSKEKLICTRHNGAGSKQGKLAFAEQTPYVDQPNWPTMLCLSIAKNC